MPDQIDYRQLAQALIAESAGPASTAYKAVSSTPQSTYSHGPGGLFSSPALDAQLFSAMVMPRMGLADRLPARGSMYAEPLYGIVTGVTATTGDEPNGPCDDFPVAGLVKLCSQTSYFGRQGRNSPVMEVDRMGLLTNRGEHTDFRLNGNPLAGATSATVPTIPGMTGFNGALNAELGTKLLEMAVSWARDFAKEVYTGNPVNNTAGGGRKYYRGMDLLINTGYRDAETGIACPAADSIVRSFGNRDVADFGASFVQTVTNIHRNLRYIANGAGLNPVKWAITMTWAAFYEITEVWPCSYLTYRCNTDDGQRFDAGRAIDMRNGMRGNIDTRTGQYLLIDDERVEVIIDDGIDEQGIGAGTFRSALYWVPLTVLGGTPVTYWEYLDYNAPNGALASAQAMAPTGSYRTSDGGRFLWHTKPPTNFCVQMVAKTEPRIILRTPYLAARLTGVQYTPIQHQRDPFTDGTYFVDGGNTSRAGLGPSWYTPTS